MTAVAIQAPPLAEVERMFLKGFTKPSSRSLQTKLGPSEVGGCFYCVGYTMASKVCEMPDREADSFGYAAHIGTMCHYYLEHKLDLVYGADYDIESHRETKLKDIFEVPGYGKLSGNCDLMVPDWARTFDYKFPGKWSYDKVKLAIRKGGTPSMEYRVQQQIYAQGWIQAGYQIDSCVIIFLPRHTNAVSDVIFWEEPVNQELYEKAIGNAETIWEYVKDGQIAELPSDPECYTCDRHGRGNLTNYLNTTN
jgi:hypothetical protein